MKFSRESKPYFFPIFASQLENLKKLANHDFLKSISILAILSKTGS